MNLQEIQAKVIEVLKWEINKLDLTHWHVEPYY